MTTLAEVVTERLVLRPIDLLDREPIRAAASRREVADTTISIPHPFSARDAQQVFSQALSFSLTHDAWGRGYMGEAIGAVLRLAFRDFACKRVYASHMVRNPASGRVLARHGFRAEGVLRKRVRKRGVFEDAILQALLRGDWLEADDSGR